MNNNSKETFNPVYNIEQEREQRGWKAFEKKIKVIRGLWNRGFMWIGESIQKITKGTTLEELIQREVREWTNHTGGPQWDDTELQDAQIYKNEKMEEAVEIFDKEIEEAAIEREKRRARERAGAGAGAGAGAVCKKGECQPDWANMVNKQDKKAEEKVEEEDEVDQEEDEVEQEDEVRKADIQ